MDSLEMLIDGKYVPAASGARFDSINPFTGVAWASVPDAGVEDIDCAVNAARRALSGPWASMTGAERARLLHRLADLLEGEAAALAAVESRDNGKLLREMQGQMRSLPGWYRYFAGLADKVHGLAVSTDKPNYFAYTREEPVGVVAAIVPWNSPLLLLAWKLAPGLAAGCTFVVKPSEHASASTCAFARVVAEAGFPPGVLNVVTASTIGPAAHLIAHPGVDKVAFTGSTEAGIKVGQAALGHLGRILLELGGKSAQLVFPDADLAAAANGVVAGIFAATGQTCMAGSRLVCHRDIAAQLLERLTARAGSIVLGNPAEPATHMGPISNPAQLRRVTGLVEDAVTAGARVICGGGVDPDLGGLFFQPTILADVPGHATIGSEEAFGPVLVVSEFSDEDEAVAAANATRYGLAASVWTTDVHRAHRVAHRLRAGTVWINSYRVVSPDVPFGGLGLSGLGRESGVDAIREYTETKAVWIELSSATRDPFVLG